MVEHPETRPPWPWTAHVYHWLHSERAAGPTISAWDIKKEQWICFGEALLVSPREMRHRGWTWFAPAIPTKHPIYDKERS